MSESIARIVLWWKGLGNGMLLLIFLSVYTVISLIEIGSSSVFPFYSLVIFLASGFFFWWIFRFFSSQKKSWRNLLISLIITFLIWHYCLEYMDLVWAPLVAFGVVFAKFILYYRGVSLVNPAVFGLLVGTFAVSLYERLGAVSTGFVSWWGVNPGGNRVLLVFMILWCVYESWKARKHRMIVGYLATYAVLFLLSGKFALVHFAFLDPTIYFFAGVMLVEPKTAPIFPWQQWMGGILAAVVLFTLNYYTVSYQELWALVAVNIWNAALRIKMFPPVKKPTAMVA